MLIDYCVLEYTIGYTKNSVGSTVLCTQVHNSSIVYQSTQ